jgi:hypothetical protein
MVSQRLAEQGVSTHRNGASGYFKPFTRRFIVSLFVADGSSLL